MLLRTTLLLSAALYTGCCIPFPVQTTVTPGVHGQIANTQPVPQASVSVGRYVYYPHFNPDDARVSHTQTAPDGSFRFEKAREREWMMPLMIHGMPGFGWQLCVEADGYATALRELDLNENGEVTIELELERGDRTPCAEIMGQERLDRRPTTASPTNDAGLTTDGTTG